MNLCLKRLLLQTNVFKAVLPVTVKMGGLISYLAASFLHQSEIRPNLNSEVPLPSTIHGVIDRKEFENKALFIIGDVHGCYDELRELLDMAKKETTKEMTIVLVGDLVNKGPQNKQVLEFVEGIGAYSVRGNHDNAVLNQYILYKSKDGYKLPTKYEWVSDLSEKNANFLQELPYTISIPSHNVIVVHAGLLPGKPLELQTLSDMIVMRNIVERDCFDGGPFAVQTINKGRSWISYWTGKKHVYFGHDAIRGLQTSTYATGLDTGCVYGFCLSGVFVNEAGEVESLLQVKAKKAYQPVDTE